MRTVRDVAAKILANNNVPCWAMSSVKLLLDLSSDIFLDVVFLEGGGRDVYALLLQILTHIDRFDDGFRASDAVIRYVFCGTTISGGDSVLLVGHDGGGGIVEMTIACHRSFSIRMDGDLDGLKLRHFPTQILHAPRCCSALRNNRSCPPCIVSALSAVPVDVLVVCGKRFTSPQERTTIDTEIRSLMRGWMARRFTVFGRKDSRVPAFSDFGCIRRCQLECC